MAVPASKDELLVAIDKAYAKLQLELDKVPSARVREQSMAGHAAGTMMSPADLVAYLVGWNELVLKWLERDDRGEPVDFPEAGFKWNQLGSLAQKFYRDHEAQDWPDLRERLNRVKQNLVATITARGNVELYETAWYNQWTKGRMIQFNTSSPYDNARNRVRTWLKQA